MPPAPNDVVPLRTEQDIVLARQLVRKLAVELGFSLVDQTKMVTAASELARNAVVHGKGGRMVCELLEDGARPVIYHGRAATCWHPGVKGINLAVNTIYNHWRFEDVWLER